MIKLNSGAKPLATVGSAIGNRKVLTGSPTILGNQDSIYDSRFKMDQLFAASIL